MLFHNTITSKSFDKHTRLVWWILLLQGKFSMETSIVLFELSIVRRWQRCKQNWPLWTENEIYLPTEIFRLCLSCCGGWQLYRRRYTPCRDGGVYQPYFLSVNADLPFSFLHLLRRGKVPHLWLATDTSRLNGSRTGITERKLSPTKVDQLITRHGMALQ